MKSITPTELKQKISAGENWQIIDIREPYEVEEASIDCLLIPMADIESRVSEIAKDVNVAIICNSGNRSKAVVNLLETEHSLSNLHSVEGGIKAWMEE